MNQKTLIAFNTAASYTRQAVRLLINFALVPFIIIKVGKDGYGLIQNVLTLVGFLIILDAGMSAAVERFVAREVALGNDRGCQETWITSLTAYLVPFGAVVLLVPPLSPWIVATIKLDPDSVRTAIILLLIAGATLAVSFPTNAYRGVLRGQQREYSIAKVEIAVELLRAGLIVLVLTYVSRSVVWFLAVTAATTVVGYAALAVLVHRGYSWARFDRTAVRRERLGEVLRFSAGSFIAQVGSMLNLFLHRFLIGALIGPAALAEYFVTAVFFRDTLDGLLMQFSGTMVPVAARFQATEQRDSLKQLLLRGSKYVVLLSGLLIAPLAAFAEPLLNVWLENDPSFTRLWPLFAGILAATWLELTRGSCHAVLVGMGRLRLLGIVNILAVLFDGGVALVLLAVTDWGLYCFLAAAFAGVLLRRPIINWYACRVVGVPLSTYYYRCVASPALPALAAYVAGRAIQRVLTPEGYPGLLLGGAVSVAAGVAFCAAVTLSREERGELLSPLRAALSRLRGT